MEVRKLYYEDPMLKTFTACVTGCKEDTKGWQVTLDATAFYPEGGGQACDLGSLGDARVLEVREQDGQVIHVCDRPLEVDTQVTGSIDWERRFDLMQQHSGEHILSGLIHKRFGYHNVGFHIGKDVMEVDFDGPVDPEALEQLEQQANRAVWENLPIRCWYPSEDQLPTVGYRRKKDLSWPVRIVQVPGYDSCACCGVHVPFTGAIGLIKVLSCVKFHSGVRLQMVCGQRAYEHMRRVYEQNRQVSQTLSAKTLETGSAAARLLQQLNDEKFRAAGLEKKLFAATAAAYAGKGHVVCFEQGLTPAAVRELADAIAGVCGGSAAVFSGCDEKGYSLCICSHSGDVKTLGDRLKEQLGARGGGKSGMFQGNVSATRQQIEETIRL